MTPTSVVAPRARLHRWKRYPAYKPVDVTWLGEIPDNWGTLPLKRIASIRYGLGQPPPEMMGGVPLLRATNVNRGVISDKEMMYVDATQVPEGKQATLSAGEIIIVRSGAYTGDSAIVPHSYAGAIAGYDMVAKITKGFSKFFAWQLLSREVQELQFGFASLRAAQPHLNAEELGRSIVVYPTIREQRQIASFLDRETAEIDALIAKKQRLIELLQEKRTALISYAVTKGLDPGAPMKESGVEWIGCTPAHWRVKKLKYCLSKMEQGWSPTCENRPADEGEWGVLKVGCVNGTEFDAAENKALPSDLEPIPELEIRSGDVLMSRANTRELLGSASVVREIQPQLLLCDKLYRLRCRPSDVDVEFLVHALASPSARYQMEIEATGASGSMQNIAQGTVWNLSISLPSIEEQRVIVETVSSLSGRIDGLVFKVDSAILRLREYRTALISAAVTGKIDVREEVG